MSPTVQRYSTLNAAMRLKYATKFLHGTATYTLYSVVHTTDLLVILPWGKKPFTNPDVLIFGLIMHSLTIEF